MTGAHTPEAPVGVDLSRPSAARVYDWYLGGMCNWAVDREFGQKAMATFPLIPQLARHNRTWLRRVVRAALDAGITQFLDLGAGVPTAGAVHEVVADRCDDPDARVVYVDNEPVAAAHANLILERQRAQHWVGVVEDDMRRPEQVLASEEVRRLIDFDRPVCVLMVAVLHFVGDGVPAIIGGYTERMASGSWMAISHIANDTAPQEQYEQLQRFAEAYQDTQNPGYLRSHDEIRAWFSETELLPPGVVALPDWQPEEGDAGDGEAVRGCGWCAVGRVP